MAEKGFGVKEINLIGASGTPTIESPNNLNLNAVNVAISTNVSIGGTLSVTGNVSVGGTLTYEEVTNIDSIGIITARNGLKVTGGTSFFAGAIAAAGAITGTASTATNVTVADESSDTQCFPTFVTAATGNLPPKTGSNLTFNSSNGTLTATTFSGSGASLTNIPAATPTDSDIQVAYTVTANGSSAYRFAGNGVVSTADNPDLYLIRGQKYRFINNSGGSHPFQIREASGGTAYSTGVTNNGASSGNIDFAPTYDSPAQLVYQCTSHGGMVGNIYLRGAAGNENNVGVTTSTNGLLVHREVNADISGGSSYDFTLPANCYKVDFVGHNIRMSASGTPSFQVGTTAGMITSGGKYNYTETAYGGSNAGRYQSGDNEIRFGYYNLNASSDTGEVFATFESSSAANMWVFNIDAHRRTQAGYLKAAGALDLSGNNLTTIRFYGWAGVNIASGRISWNA